MLDFGVVTAVVVGDDDAVEGRVAPPPGDRSPNHGELAVLVH
jgi:hypothetical protein